MEMMTIVGCGPGSLDHVTTAARRAIEAAEVLVGARRLLELFPSVPAERIVVGADIPKTLDQIAAHAGRRKVVVLVSGDPGVCSLARPVIQRFGRAACRVVAGISSVQVAFARLGLDWFDARLLSAHERRPEVDVDVLAGEKTIAVLAGNAATTPWIVALAQRLADSHRIFVCENLTLPEELVRTVTAAELAALPLLSRTIVLFIRKELVK